MLITRDITLKTLKGSCHMKYTNLCNEEKRNKTMNTKVFNYKTKPQITKLIYVKKVIQPCESDVVTFIF